MVEQANLELLQSGNHNTSNYDFQDDVNLRIDPYSLFLHAMKSPVTKKKYSRRLEMFFDFIKIPGESIEEQCLTFVNTGKNNINWVFTNILKFVLFYKQRIDKKEISGATLINYLKAIKFVCYCLCIYMFFTLIKPWVKIWQFLQYTQKGHLSI
jgi:hypothetical protein